MITEEDLPDDWKLFKLKDICLKKAEYGSGAKAVDYDETKPRYIRITDIDDNGNLKLINKVSPSEVEEKYFLNDGDFLFARSGSVGKTFLYEKKYGLCQYAGYLIRFKPNHQVIDPNYLNYLTKSPYYWNWIASKKKTMTISNINAKQYSNLKIPVSPLFIQHKIVKILIQVDQLKERRIEADKLTDYFLKSMFFKMFGDPINNTKRWKTKKLKYFGEIKTGNTPPRKKSEYYGDYIDWIKSDNINTPFTYLTESEEKLSKKGAEVGRIVPQGFILVTCIAGSLSCIGNVAIADRKVSFNQQINAITPKSDVNELFLYHLILNSQNYLQKFSTQALKGIINKRAFESVNFIFPPYDLQLKFGRIAAQIEQLKTHQMNSKIQINNLFNILMQKAFKGELEC